MKLILKNIYRSAIKIFYRKAYNFFHQIGNKKKCYICNKEFGRFIKYKGGWKRAPLWIKKIDPIGSDLDNFNCPYCFSNDRERHLFMYFDKLCIWEKMKNSQILHFAPEAILSMRIEQMSPFMYVKGDLFPYQSSIIKLDATDIPYGDSTFDCIIFNHILEHIPNYQKALSEIYRVLKPNGIAILQTPYSELFHENFENSGINTDELRLFFYGKEDHVRFFGKKPLFKALESAGFQLSLTKHSTHFSDEDAAYYGVNKNEDLILVSKPSS
jgi:SAM-dependent methyltransferase